MTETLFAVGAGGSVVGRTSFCDYPKEALSIPIVGGFTDVSVEKVVSMSPTLVVGERRPGGRDLDTSLRAKGIETFFPPMYSVAEIIEMITTLGAKLGHIEQAAGVTKSLRDAIDGVTARVKDLPKRRTLFLFDFRPLVAAGPDAFPQELLALAGAENVVTSGGEYPHLSPEGVVALDPDLVIDGSAGTYPEPPEVLIRQVPGLDTLRALREGHVVRLTSNAAIRPGPRIGMGVADLAALVHPTT